MASKASRPPYVEGDERLARRGQLRARECPTRHEYPDPTPMEAAVLDPRAGEAQEIQALLARYLDRLAVQNEDPQLEDAFLDVPPPPEADLDFGPTSHEVAEAAVAARLEEIFEDLRDALVRDEQAPQADQGETTQGEDSPPEGGAGGEAGEAGSGEAS